MSHIPELVYRCMADNIERMFSEEGLPPIKIVAEPEAGRVRIDIPQDYDKRTWYDMYASVVDMLAGMGYTAAYMFEKNDPNYGAMYVVVYPNIGV